MPGTHASPHVFERSPGAATRPLPRGYRPRRPQATAFYRVIGDHLETMLQCPSCDGRRMAAGAADLVDHILPVVADYRQWTLSFPRCWTIDGPLDYFDVTLCAIEQSFTMEGVLEVAGYRACEVEAVETCGVITGVACGITLRDEQQRPAPARGR